ncbi:transmembrane protein 198 [Phlebotomus argentipes]|uniref:transmembrane protein 198 n=1 Tax=Phlebotomus argentipes TaxID=94469 RepID=UPI0028930D53|nr:transmembrane protein 198 [Phlebotomus argentipes]
MVFVQSEEVAKIWPFLLQGVMDTSICPTSQPDMVEVLLWTTCAVFGFVYMMLGYRCLRAIGFLTGLAAGAGCVLWLQRHKTLLGSPGDSALAVAAGLCGAMLGSTHPVASALVSAIAGAIIAGATMVLCIATMPDHEFGEREIVVAVSGGAVIFAVMTLCCAKLITIVSSSVIGSTMVLLSVDFFLHSLETVKWIVAIKPTAMPPPPCWGGVIMCSWPVTALVGILAQCFITAWRLDHKKRPQPYRRRLEAPVTVRGLPEVPANRPPNPQVRPRETREEARQRKFRYLYHIRTSRGDIISQNCASALQKHIQPHSGSSSEHSTHMTHLPDPVGLDSKS